MGIPCLSISISLQPCVSNTFRLWLLVCVHASVISLLFQTRLIVGVGVFIEVLRLITNVKLDQMLEAL